MRRYHLRSHPGLQDGPIYLDYNATTPVDPAVVEAMLPYLSTYFGNPSSTHHYGQAAHQALDRLHDFSVTYLPVDEYGQVRLADVSAAIKPQTILITIMHANNETGTL